MKHILIVDDNKMNLVSAKNALAEDYKVTAVTSGMQALKFLENNLPDLILLDINMPKKNGIEVLSHIRKKKLPVKVLLLTVHNEIDYLIKALDLSVDGYIVKDSGSTELKKAIKCIINDEKYIQPSLIPALNKRLVSRDVDKDKIDSLTRREMEVLIQIANGKFNKEIANSLDISERTVKNHILNIFKKIDVNDRTQAAVFAIKNDIIKL